jgi:hypothetical protein
VALLDDGAKLFITYWLDKEEDNLMQMSVDRVEAPNGERLNNYSVGTLEFNRVKQEILDHSINWRN